MGCMIWASVPCIGKKFSSVGVVTSYGLYDLGFGSMQWQEILSSPYFSDSLLCPHILL